MSWLRHWYYARRGYREYINDARPYDPRRLARH